MCKLLHRYAWMGHSDLVKSEFYEKYKGTVVCISCFAWRKTNKQLILSKWKKTVKVTETNYYKTSSVSQQLIWRNFSIRTTNSQSLDNKRFGCWRLGFLTLCQFQSHETKVMQYLLLPMYLLHLYHDGPLVHLGCMWPVVRSAGKLSSKPDKHPSFIHGCGEFILLLLDSLELRGDLSTTLSSSTFIFHHVATYMLWLWLCWHSGYGALPGRRWLDCTAQNTLPVTQAQSTRGQ